MACELLSGFFGVLVQCLLFFTCIGILVIKKLFDRGERTWLEFSLDSSKQVLGAGWAHLLNLLSSMLLGFQFVGSQCEWYWITILLDTTIGVAVEYGLLRLSMAALRRCCDASRAEDFHQGDYYGPLPDGTLKIAYRRFLKQIVLWLLIVSAMKILIILIMVISRLALMACAKMALYRFSDNSKLIFVMVITPGVMNAFQMVVVDAFIRKRPGIFRASLMPTMQSSVRPLSMPAISMNPFDRVR